MQGDRDKGEGVQMLRSALELERRACGIYWWVLVQVSGFSPPCQTEHPCNWLM